MRFAFADLSLSRVPCCRPPPTSECQRSAEISAEISTSENARVHAPCAAQCVCACVVQGTGASTCGGWAPRCRSLRRAPPRRSTPRPPGARRGRASSSSASPTAACSAGTSWTAPTRPPCLPRCAPLRSCRTVVVNIMLAVLMWQQQPVQPTCDRHRQSPHGPHSH